MNRKICSIGNSQGVSVPIDMLARLHLTVGSEVDIHLDESGTKIVVEPAIKKRYPRGLDEEFVAQVNEFIAKYRPALNELAKK
jgi:antitoxin component of MazEF toxin-antitoxin module